MDPKQDQVTKNRADLENIVRLFGSAMVYLKRRARPVFVKDAALLKDDEIDSVHVPQGD